MRVRSPAFGGAWVPVFASEAARRAAETHWPVGLNARELRCIVCNPSQPTPQVPPGFLTIPSCWEAVHGPWNSHLGNFKGVIGQRCLLWMCMQQAACISQTCSVCHQSGKPDC